MEYPIYYITKRENERIFVLQDVKRDNGFRRRIWTTDLEKGLSFYMPEEAQKFIDREIGDFDLSILIELLRTEKWEPI